MLHFIFGAKLKEELEIKLKNKYPKLLTNLVSVDTGDGWFDLISELCKNIQVRATFLIEQELRINPDSDVTHLQPIVSQIKEKFGTLRCHIIPCDDEMFGMIQMAESMSYHICESCGNKATETASGWIRRLCSTCAKMREAQ